MSLMLLLTPLHALHFQCHEVTDDQIERKTGREVETAEIR